MAATKTTISGESPQEIFYEKLFLDSGEIEILTRDEALEEIKKNYNNPGEVLEEWENNLTFSREVPFREMGDERRQNHL